MSCEHEPRTVYFSLKNKILKCRICNGNLKLSDEEYHDWIFCKNAYRDESNKTKYNFIVVKDEDEEKRT